MGGIRTKYFEAPQDGPASPEKSTGARRFMVPTKLDRVASLFSEGVEQTPPTMAERRRRRLTSLRENSPQQLRRVAAALSALGKPGGVVGLLGAANLLFRDGLLGSRGLPDPHAALKHPEGLCGLARKPSPAEALEAYASGLVLHAPIGPACWWSPARRWGAAPGDAKAAAEAFAHLTDLGASIEMDGDLDPVLVACSRPDAKAGRSGFGENLMRIYSDLADFGLVHSIAVRTADGRLAGGAFGLAIGRVFVTESVFGPSDVARSVMSLLDRELAVRNFTLHEARLGPRPGAAPSPAFDSFGFAPMSRMQFVAAANQNLSKLKVQQWRLHAGAADKRGETLLARLRPACASAS
jgi:leucyl/phenylalanyl-tRNA--protein transferase